MLAISEIELWHKELADLCRGCLVLLGGSAATRELTEDSDVDFFVIGSVWRVIKIKKNIQKIKDFKKRYPLVNIMLIPGLFFQRGWYYVRGKDLNGKIWLSGKNEKIYFRNTLKLAGQSLMMARQEGESHELIKALRRIVAAEMVLINGWSEEQDLTTLKNVREYLFKKNNVEAKKMLEIINSPAVNNTQESIKKNLIDIFVKGKKYFNFSWFNYFFYNFRFLLKGKIDFLFSNPDKKIMKEILALLDKDLVTLDEYERIKKIVFPVFII